MSAPPSGHMQPQLRWWTRMGSAPRHRATTETAAKCSPSGAGAVDRRNGLLERGVHVAVQSRLEQAQDGGFLGLEAGEVVAQLGLDLVLDLEEERPFHVGAHD